MQTNLNLVAQARRVANEVGRVLGRTVSLDQLESIYSVLDNNTDRTVTPASEICKSRKVHPAAPKKSARKAPKPLTTPSGRYSKNLKKVRPEPGDVMVSAVRKGKSYAYPGTPELKDMLDGPVTVFLNFTDAIVIRKFKANLRAKALKNGFGLRHRHLAYNRITIELCDIDHEYRTKRNLVTKA